MPWRAYVLAGGLGALAKRVQTAGLAAAIVGGITYMYKTKLGLFIMGALIWLGINFATIKIIIDPAISLLRGYASSGMGGGEFANAAIAWMGVLNFDRAITMIISAVAAKHAVMQGRLFLFKKGFGAQ